jgi:hypothetical protein
MRCEDTTEGEWVYLERQSAKESGPRSEQKLKAYEKKYGLETSSHSGDIICAMYAFVRAMKCTADAMKDAPEAPRIVALFKVRLHELLIAYRSEPSSGDGVPTGINAVNTWNADGLISMLMSDIAINEKKTTNAVLVLFLRDLLNERTHHDLALANPYDATDSQGNPAAFCDEPRTSRKPPVFSGHAGTSRSAGAVKKEASLLSLLLRIRTKVCSMKQGSDIYAFMVDRMLKNNAPLTHAFKESIRLGDMIAFRLMLDEPRLKTLLERNPDLLNWGFHEIIAQENLEMLRAFKTRYRCLST